MDFAIGVAPTVEQQSAGRFEQRLYGKFKRRANHHILCRWIDDLLELGLDWHVAYSARRPIMLGFARQGLYLRQTRHTAQ